MYAQWKKGLLIMLRTETARRIPGIHFSSTSWAPKKGVPAGRPIGDPSNAPRGQSALNDIRLHEVLKELWGPIQHPTLVEIIVMLLEAAKEFGWDELRLWKMDLKAAFTLMYFKEQVVRLLAFELTEGFTMIHIAGFFGWTGTPFAFEAITRVLRHYVKSLIKGHLKMYVDDLIGVSHVDSVSQDMSAAKEGIIKLLGSKAIADEKTETGRVMEAIGWRINLDTRTVTLSELNLAKTVYAFFSVREDQPMDVKILEGLASRASRCAAVCRAMKPHKVALYDALRGKDRYGRHKVTLGQEAQVDIWMWRTYLCSIECDPLRMERSMESFGACTPTLVISFDASLEGYGVGISTLPAEGPRGDAWETLIEYTALEVPFPLAAVTDRHNSSYQNNCEFVAIVIGLWMAGRRGMRDFSYVLKGDSMSALSWAMEDRAESMISRRASICFSLLSIHLNASVAEAVHVPGVENIICDGLSRGKRGAEVGLPPEKFREFTEDQSGLSYLMQCNPLESVGGVAEHGQWIRALTAILREL